MTVPSFSMYVHIKHITGVSEKMTGFLDLGFITLPFQTSMCTAQWSLLTFHAPKATLTDTFTKGRFAIQMSLPLLLVSLLKA